VTLWSGRLPDPPAEALWSFTVDRADARLLPYDIEGSIAHAAMLHEAGLLTAGEHDAIDRGLRTMLEEALSGSFPFDPEAEDVHTLVEHRLGDVIGSTAQRLHAGRSRNDQVATDLRLYLRAACARHEERLLSFVRALADQAAAHTDTVAAVYTHLQQAQAAPLAHHLLAHAWPAVRDRDRFADLRRRLGESPLGAGAAAGSSLPIDPQATARGLGFGSVAPNSIDAVASRDLAAEFVWCCAQAMVSRSRLAEELVLWSTEEFAWATVPDALATGSSALPHKKNPDIAELARGRAAGTIGDLTAILALQRSLPLAYNRDLQEDKTHVFRADDTLTATLGALTAVVADTTFHPPPPGPWVGSLDLTEVLVRRGVPFRVAHAAVGRLVAALVAEERTFAEATPSDLGTASDLFEGSDLEVLASPPDRHGPGFGPDGSITAQLEALERVLDRAEKEAAPR
jgi:argininosuccinate lyase